MIFLSYFEVVFIDNLPLSVLLECTYSPLWLPWPPVENKRRSTECHWFGEEGEDGLERQLQKKGCGQRRGMCQARIEEGVLMGWDQWARGAWVGLVYLDTSFGPQLIGSLHLFVLGMWSWLFCN